MCGRMQSFLESYILEFDEEVFRECCERFQVPLNQKVGKLSTGYQVRFQLAFALSHDAKLLFWMSLHQDWTHYFEKN